MNSRKLNLLTSLLIGIVVSSTASAGIVEHAVRAPAAGVDVIVYPMGVKDVITVMGSLPAGDSYAAQGNIAAATLTGLMLDKGTTKQDKLAIAKQLDDAGAQLAFDVDAQMVTLQARLLKKDLPLVLRLMAQELRTPAFSSEEFAKVKKQFEASVIRAQQDTNERAAQAFSNAVYPAAHPNRQHTSEEWLAAADKITVEDLKSFHDKYYGPAHFTLVFVGDVDASRIRREVAQAFAGWTGGVDVVRAVAGGTIQGPREEAVQLADKASVSVRLGQQISLRYQDRDSLALRVGTQILGSDFTSRLMSTVRDQEGLTYGIRAQIADDTFVEGDWSIRGAFSPQLLDRGIVSTRRELAKWWQDGVTAAELDVRKTNMTGSYKVGLATSAGMARAILQTVDRGMPLTWLDDYPTAIRALTVEQVNTAIKKYLDPQKMVLVKVGTVPTS